MKQHRWFKAGWPPIVVVILLLLLWQLAVTWGGTASWLLPSPLKNMERRHHGYAQSMDAHIRHFAFDVDWV
ncbi:hypothetical protein [Paenibacillus sp. V4I7]|uniref:hypothetical protein n=1 Tax=Paenibacillus sp. V4I7 TaxID=3042307 RepID=UPI0027803248|nr:ABC-type nitrate/sulfonate/bicarbonate transport system permease component [Paenibacillus sp. V4I7]